MERTQIKQLIRDELPIIMQEDVGMEEFVLRLSRQHFAAKEETESRFDRVLDELRRSREESMRKREAKEREDAKKWEENQRKWEAKEREDAKKWEENQRKWEAKEREDAKKWEENQRKWEAKEREDAKKWEENQRKWDENQAQINEMLASIKDLGKKWEAKEREDAKKWEENQVQHNEMLAAIKDLGIKYKSSIGALGARWGLYIEESFRNALRGILESSFSIEVLNVTDYDEEGEVFGHPDQIEIDVIIKNGLLIACEIKSSMSKSDMYIFERKARFYEKLHDKTVDRIVVISPMVAPNAFQAAKDLGIKIYSYSSSMPKDFFD